MAQHGHWNRKSTHYLISSILRGQLHLEAAPVPGDWWERLPPWISPAAPDWQRAGLSSAFSAWFIGARQQSADLGWRFRLNLARVEKKKKELNALGSRSLTVGIRCRAPPHGNCTNMQGKNESCALASRGDEWHRLFLCKIVAKCHQVRLNLEIRVRCGWNLGVELLLFKAWKSHPGFGCSVSIPCSALQMGWTVLPAVFSCIYKYLFMNFWEAKNLQA